MNEDFTLPGADRFAEELKRRAGTRCLMKVGPYRVGHYIGHHEIWCWTILMDGHLLGHYQVHDQEPPKDDFVREWDGQVPGYVNGLGCITPHFEWNDWEYRDKWFGTEYVLTDWQYGPFRRTDQNDFAAFP